MSKRTLSTVLVLLLLVAIAWYLNVEPGRPVAPKSAPATGSTLPCAPYKEHRKEVDAAAVIPTLKDKKAPTYKVLEVIDGDTITINKDGQTKVRLMGMDTPEKSTTRTGEVQHFGEEAYRHARKLIEESGWEVRITYDQVKKDKYDRDLAYVWLKDGRMLNAVMVADGYAYSYSSSPKPQYVDTFLALMRQARAANKGLWGQCE